MTAATIVDGWRGAVLLRLLGDRAGVVERLADMGIRGEACDRVLAVLDGFAIAHRRWQADASASGTGSAEAEVVPDVPSSSSSPLGAEEVGAMLKVTRERVGQLARSHQLAGRKVGARWIFDPSDVKAFLEAKGDAA